MGGSEKDVNDPAGHACRLGCLQPRPDDPHIVKQRLRCRVPLRGEEQPQDLRCAFGSVEGPLDLSPPQLRNEVLHLMLENHAKTPECVCREAKRDPV